MAQSKETLFQKLIDARQSYDPPEKLVKSKSIKFIIIGITTLVCGVLFTLDLDSDFPLSGDYGVNIGSTWEKPTLVADFSFPVYKDNETLKLERRKAADSVLKVFSINDNAAANAEKYIGNIAGRLASLEFSEGSELPDFLPESTAELLKNYSRKKLEAESAKLKKQMSQFIEEIYKKGFIDISVERIENNEILINIWPNENIIFPAAYLTDKSTFLEKSEEFIKSRINEDLKELAVEMIKNLNVPNLYFNDKLTNKAKELAAGSVPKTTGIVKEGETIIEKGEAVSIDNAQKIISYERTRFMTIETGSSFLYILGGIGHAAFIYVILLVYLFYIRKRIWNDNVQLSILSALLIISALMSWLSVEFVSEYPLEYLVLIPAFSMLAGIIFDSRTAFYVTVTSSLMLAGIRGNDYLTGTMLVFAGTLAAYTVRDIQSRTQIFQAIFFIFLGLAFPSLIFSAERFTGTDELIVQLIFAVIASIISPLVTFGILFIIERVTNVATDLRIKEYDNLDHPLLKKMSEYAPGTYQHTLSVAMLTERCAREIGANPLLAKVGTYFHDIGKMPKPEYYTENQIDIENKHDQMSPKKSAKIIIEHVNDGIEMAYQYGLPKRIIDFIPMHHGTTLVKHFYAKAVEEYGDENVNIEDFRYPGPRPQNRETAILMICDSAEAISRLNVSKIEEIEKIIEGNIRDRMLDGQLDECGLTMNDLVTIKKVIAKNLMGMGHKRVKYKEVPGKDGK